MTSSFHEHRGIVLALGAFVLGVWWDAKGFNVGFFVLFGLWIFGMYKLRPAFSFYFVLVVLFLIGALRVEWAIPVFSESDLAYHHDDRRLIVLEGVVSDFPDVRSDQIKLVIEADGFFQKRSDVSSKEEIHGKVLVKLPRYPEYFYGDRLRFTGLLQEPAEFEDFSYKLYLQRYGIFSVMYDPRVELLQREFRKDWRFWMFRFKAALENRLNRLFPEPHASFSAGLLLGSRRGIPQAVTDDFNTTGLTHMIAISGYNITLIIVFVSGLLRGLSQRWRIVLASGVIVAFVILVGASAAVIRAAIMGVLGLWAIWFGRSSEVTRLLALTAGIMTAWNPFILLQDVGFHLSFAATCGLVYTTDWVEAGLKRLKVYERIPQIFSIRDAFLTTLAAQTFATPLIVWNFERLSLISPLANVLVASLIPFSMLFSFMALGFSYVFYEVGQVFAYFAWLCMEFILQIAHFLARVPLASLDFI